MKTTKKYILSLANEFWKRWGYLTRYNYKKDYIKYVINRFNLYKKEGNTVLEQWQQHVQNDLELRDRQVREYLDYKEKIKKVDEEIKKGIEKPKGSEKNEKKRGD